MRTAFKEWATIVDALGQGRQIIILRKGGIHEGRGGFQMEHPEFLLFPTLFHQPSEPVRAPAPATLSGAEPVSVRFEFLARVVDWRRIESFAVAQGLRGQHQWPEEVIEQRFDWGCAKGIFALAVRVYRLPQPVVLPLLPVYGGCKSWIQLEADIADAGSRPVLEEAAFALKLQAFRSALEPMVEAVPV